MVALLLALFVGAQSTAQAPARRNDTRTWYQAYADGKRAFDQKNWQAAIDSLEAAKRAGAEAGPKIPFYGDVHDDYLPDYYLGMAYLNLRQFTQADQAFAAVRASGLIGPKDREYAEFQKQTTAVTAGLRESATVAQNNQATPTGNTPPAANNPPATTNPQAAVPNPGPVATNTSPANLPTQQAPPSTAGRAAAPARRCRVAPTSKVPTGPAPAAGTAPQLDHHAANQGDQSRRGRRRRDSRVSIRAMTSRRTAEQQRRGRRHRARSSIWRAADGAGDPGQAQRRRRRREAVIARAGNPAQFEGAAGTSLRAC